VFIPIKQVGAPQKWYVLPGQPGPQFLMKPKQVQEQPGLQHLMYNQGLGVLHLEEKIFKMSVLQFLDLLFQGEENPLSILHPQLLRG